MRTGVYNRRSFFEQAAQLLHRFFDRGRSCCLAMLDVDNFKLFNDTHGHLAGDAALQHIVRTVRTVLRRNDVVARYGGEEFMFCFGGIGLKQGMALAERVRAVIAETPLLWEGKTLDLTASLGVCHVTAARAAHFSDFEELLELILKEADKHMYSAKLGGRNQVRGESFLLRKNRREAGRPEKPAENTD